MTVVTHADPLPGGIHWVLLVSAMFAYVMLGYALYASRVMRGLRASNQRIERRRYRALASVMVLGMCASLFPLAIYEPSTVFSVLAEMVLSDNYGRYGSYARVFFAIAGALETLSFLLPLGSLGLVVVLWRHAKKRPYVPYYPQWDLVPVRPPWSR